MLTRLNTHNGEWNTLESGEFRFYWDKIPAGWSAVEMQNIDYKNTSFSFSGRTSNALGAAK